MDDLRKALGGMTVTVPTAGKALGLGRDAAYRAVRAGQIPVIKIGGKYVVPTAPLRRMLGLEQEAAA